MNAIAVDMAIPVPRLFETPLVAINPVDVKQANALLIEWEHNLGACNRPFHQEAWALEFGGRIITVAVSASIVSTTAAGFKCSEVVELARQCAAPGYSWSNRVMLRLWREACAEKWPCWPVLAAISYSQNARHPGDMYRFDGWTKFSEDAGSSGGGTWSKKRSESDAVHGKKTGWLWRYGATPTTNATPLRITTQGAAGKLGRRGRG